MLNGCILFRTQFNELNLTFCEIFSSGLPKLSNFNVTADELGRVVSETLSLTYILYTKPSFSSSKLVTSSLEVSQFSLSLESSRGRHVVSIESFRVRET